MLSRRIPVSWDHPSAWSSRWELEPIHPHVPNSLFSPVHSQSLLNMPSSLLSASNSAFALDTPRSLTLDMPRPLSLDAPRFHSLDSQRHLQLMDVEMRRQFQAMDLELQRMSQEMSRRLASQWSSFPLLDASADSWRLKERLALEHPVRQTHEGRRVFNLEFDTRQFKPEEIMVQTFGKQLTVHARHEEKDEGKSVHREYHRTCLLPKEVNPETLSSKLSQDGLLTIEAPLPALEHRQEKLIPIEHKK